MGELVRNGHEDGNYYVMFGSGFGVLWNPVGELGLLYGLQG